MLRSPAFIALVLFSPLTAAAQGTALQAGVRLRVEALAGRTTERTTGTLLRVSGDSLVIATKRGHEQPIALSALRRVQVSKGRSAPKGALKGFLIGAGVTAGLALYALAKSDEPEAAGMITAVLLPVFGFVGAIVGLVIGREGWATVPR